MNTTGPPFVAIKQALHSGRVVPFLGSGASLPADHDDAATLKPELLRPPSAAQLTRYLATRCDITPEDATDLPRTAQHYDTMLGLGSLYEQLHHVFAQPFPPARLHKFLAHIPSLPLIVTTNYDDLIERAFREVNRPYHLVMYNRGTNKVRIWRHGAAEPEEALAKNCDITVSPGSPTVIYKMHGTVDPSAASGDDYVITEEDYVEFLSRLGTSGVMPAAFAEVFRTSHILFLGYSLRDWNVRVVLHEIWRDWHWRYQSWAVQKSASALDRTFWERKRLSIFTMTIDAFLDGLEGHAIGMLPSSGTGDAGR